MTKAIHHFVYFVRFGRYVLKGAYLKWGIRGLFYMERWHWRCAFGLIKPNEFPSGTRFI